MAEVIVFYDAKTVKELNQILVMISLETIKPSSVNVSASGLTLEGEK